MSPRIRVPAATEKEIKIRCRGLCCICHHRGIQIHHIDGNNSNNEMDNLAPLCVSCHSHQSATGGFEQRLTQVELKEVRDRFYAMVPSQSSQAQITKELNDLKAKFDHITRIVEATRNE